MTTGKFAKGTEMVSGRNEPMQLSKLKTLLFAGIAIIMSLLVLLPLLELAVRAIGLEPLHKNRYTQYDPMMGYVGVPGEHQFLRIDSPDTVKNVFNSSGFISAEFTTPR